MSAMFNLTDFYYTIDEKQYFLYDAIREIKKVIAKGKGIFYYNVPAAFDIETSSFINPNQEKCGIMYHWQFGINGRCIVGRTWQEFKDLLSYISKELELNEKRRLIVYVHNLKYEFQFMRKHFNWLKVFNLDERKPVYAIADNGIEFRCSYLLSGLSLEIVGKNLQKYKCQKLIDGLDYSKLRHCETPLTDTEIEYCLNDIRVVMAYIQEMIENNKNNISELVLTNTGIVRRYCREECFKSLTYKKIIRQLTIETVDEYEQAKRAFQGGFTHANAYYAEKTLSDIASFDFTSSYPYVMLSEKFPMSKGRLIDSESLDSRQLEYYLKNYCCIFDVYFEKLTPRINFENYISTSKCRKLRNYIANNGRIVQADYLQTTVTEQDFAIIRFCYDFESFGVANFRIYRKEYLPTEFVRAILKLYADKTQLKGVEGKESEYLLSKGMLNSCYGMCVTDFARNEYVYTDNHEWTINKPDLLESIRNNNESKNRFLFYLWGVYVTAYARRNLFDGIAEFAQDYVYSDTDSLKVRNYEKHMPYIESYNREVEVKLNLACKYHGISYNEMRPKNIKGQIKLIGIWDFEGVYKRFKTLGAKRYMVETVDENGKSNYSFTVAGCNKKYAIPYMIDKFGTENLFDSFDNFLEIPAGFTGKNTHTYIDDRRQGTITDYLGHVGSYDELSSLHLENAAYSLFMPKHYIDFINDIQNEIY